jgi:hypothetical protein
MRCVPFKELGVECSSARECGIYRRCFEGTCQKPAAEGEACDDELLNCQFLLECRGGRCEPAAPEPGELNEPCGALFEDCVDGAYCESPENVCQTTVRPGEVCSYDAACGVGYTCDDVCFEKLAVGATCLFAGECASDYCGNGTCAELPVCE